MLKNVHIKSFIFLSEHAVNVKFQRLRVHFSRELRKEESSAKANEAHLYQSKWRYYNNMLFLKDTLKCRLVHDLECWHYDKTTL